MRFVDLDGNEFDGEVSTVSSSTMSWGWDGSFSHVHWPPLTRRQRWAARLRLARMQLRPCWRGWGHCSQCGRRRDGLRRAWYAIHGADVR